MYRESMRLLVLTMLLACTRRPFPVIENRVPFEPVPPSASNAFEYWLDRCERLGRTPRYIEYGTRDWGVILYGC